MHNYSSYTDEQLLLKPRSSDHHALRALHDRYWQKLFIAAHSRLNDPQAAEEVVQDILINLWNKREQLQLKHSLNTYLATAVKYEVINRIVKKKRQLSLELQDTVPELPDNKPGGKIVIRSFTEQVGLAHSIASRKVPAGIYIKS